MKNCPHFPRCGGCSRLDVPYREQLSTKRQMLSDLFSRFDVPVSPVFPSPQHYYYRHKVQLPFGYAGRGTTGKPLLGCYATDSHRVVDQHHCLIQERELSIIAWTIRAWADRTGLSVYDERTGKGFLRHVLLRKGAGTGEVLVGLVTNGKRPEGSRQLARLLLSMIDDVSLKESAIVGIVQNVNLRHTNVVLGTEEHVWWGRTYIKELLGTWRYKISCSTFFQVNPFQTPRLYNEVKRHVPQHSRVVDYYCGVGSIALWISDKAAAVHGIEENRSAVQAARTASKLNDARNITFTPGDAGDALLHFSKEGFSCAVVDPPRKGIGSQQIKMLTSSRLERIIYVSCNPHTLKRDAKFLQHSFQLISLQGIDMFPHTDHCECVAVFDRK